ncbi:MAG: M16 family metallopeptidase [Microgenomates group bacterium]
MDNYNLISLKNGLHLITIPMPRLESVTVMVGVGAGSRYETRRTNGLAHFLEHMAFKGTKKRPTTKAIASEIEAVGGVFNAFTDKEFTGYWVKLPLRHLPLACDILSDMLTNSLLKTEEIERERGVIIEEINMREDVPMTKVAVEFERLLYGDNPMGWDIAGEKETVAKIRRSDFLEYLARLYYPQNMVVAVAGGIKLTKLTKLTELTEEFFGSLRAAGKAFGDAQREVGHKITKSIKIQQDKPRLKLITKKTEQAHFCLGVPGYSLKDRRRWALGVLTAILGAGMSSRLFLEIRERRGLAYYVGSEAEFYTDSGYLVSRAGVKLGKVEEAIKLIQKEMEKLVSKKVSEKELTKVKEMLKGNLILGLEDSQNVASRAATQLILEGKVRTPKQALAEIDKVTAEDVQQVAKEIFKPEKINLTVVGPYKNPAQFSKLLGC